MDLGDKSFGVTLNQDSFPEIDETIVRGYLEQIRRTTSKFILSINHEVQHEKAADAKHLNVSALLENNDGFARVYRNAVLAPPRLRGGAL